MLYKYKLSYSVLNEDTKYNIYHQHNLCSEDINSQVLQLYHLMLCFKVRWSHLLMSGDNIF